MIKNKVATLAKNLKTNKDVRTQSIQLITELAGVAASVTNGNHSFKLQRLISRTTLGFSTAVVLRTLIQIIQENSKVEELEPIPDQFFVRVFHGEVLFNEIKNHIRKNYTKQIAVDSNTEPEVVYQSLNIADHYNHESDETCETVADLPPHLRALVEGTDSNKGVHVYIEPRTLVESVLHLGDEYVTVRFVNRTPPPQPKMVQRGDGTVSWEEPKESGSRRGMGSDFAKKLESQDSYLFECWTIEERDAVYKFLLELAPKAHNIRSDNEVVRGSADIYVADAKGSGSWSQIPARTADTVILPDGQLTEIVREIRTFLQYEKLYYMLGVPYHHGVMLSGAPGTGKSSAAQAIASELHMQTYSASLSTLESNDAFLKFIKNVSTNSVVLLEDIDVASAVTRSDGGGVTMETLLNVLDGVLSPHGCVFILTTNYLDKIDPAVVRPGRIDATYDITYLIDEQFERLCRKFMQIKDDVVLDLPSVEGLNITPAAIVGVIKKYIPNLSDALPHVTAFVDEKRVAAMEKSLASK